MPKPLIACNLISGLFITRTTAYIGNDVQKSCKFLGFTLEANLPCPHFLIQAQSLSKECCF